MSIKEERAVLQAKFDEMKAELEKAQRRLQKLDKVQDLNEPEPGSVLRFSRSMAGSRQKYTFVAFRSGPFVKSWHLTGKANALRLLGLAEGGNSWEDLLIAIGDADVVFATDWSSNPDSAYLYFRGYATGKVFRVKRDADPRTAMQVRNPTTGRWHTSTFTTRGWVENNPGSHPAISAEEANA